MAAGPVGAVAFGWLSFSNPDLPERLRLGAPRTPYSQRTFYGGEAERYTDYPTLAEAAAE
ncbi:hypothetical protein [Methylobacterium sp. 6HR-1]|uniref:hypothetical protein n=1 Tax=Methylobacterium nonmethylotrophicum TaxID=1141884 RepID=UPI00108192B1